MEKQDTGILQNEIKVYVGSVLRPDKAVHACSLPKQSLMDILYTVCNGSALIARHARVYVGVHFIPLQNLEWVYPKEEVTIQFIPAGGGGGGGKNPLKTVLSLAAIVATGGISGALTGALGITSALGTALVRGAVGAVLNLAINAIAPPPKPKLNSFSPLSSQSGQDSPTFYIQGAKNDLRPFGVVPVVIGTHRLVPPQSAKPYTESSGLDQYVRQLFTWGYGQEITLNEEKIGDTLLSNYSFVTREDILDGDSNVEIDLYPDLVNQSQLSIALNDQNVSFIQTTSGEVNEFSVDVAYPRGTALISDSGSISFLNPQIRVEYRVTDSGDPWTQGGVINAIHGTTSGYSNSLNVLVPTLNQYDVRMTRISASVVDSNTQELNQVVWTSLRGFTYGQPVRMDNINLTAIRIKGTDQLNGAVDQYNAVVSHAIPDWDSDTETWIVRNTSNPASWYRYILQGAPNANPLTDSQIDLETLQIWHNYCVERGFTCNGVIDYETTVANALDDICAAGRAQKTIRDNKFSVVVDMPKSDIVQLVSPRNSYDYSIEIAYPILPHAFRVQFINAEKGYLQDERIVYDDGYDETNATEFERLELTFVTTPELAYIHGREHIASIRLRRFTHLFSMDIENLAFERGDLIRFNNDIILQGLGSARIKSLTDDGTNVTALEIDDVFPMETGKSYAVRVRFSDGTQEYYPVNTVAGEQTTITLTTPVLIANAPEVNDLLLMGEAGTESRILIVQEIASSADFVAGIKAVDYAPAIYEAANGVIPPFVSNITLPQEFQRPSSPILVNVQGDEEVQIVNLDGSISNRLVISLTNENIGNIEVITKIREVGANGYINAQTIENTPNRVIIEGLSVNTSYDILVYYKRNADLSNLNNNSISAPLVLNGVTFLGASAPPPDVENFDITVRSDSVFLSWDAVNVIDLDRYEIRFNSNTTGATWSNSLPIVTNLSKNTTTYTAFSKIGTYLIKAVDRTGTYSVNPTLAVTTIGELSGLNFIKTIDESASWGGTFEATVNDGGDLKLGSDSEIDDWTLIDDIIQWDLGEDGLAQTGIYYFENTEDLGEIYTSVLSADIAVSGENVFDLIDEWDFIDDRESWDGTNPSQYSVVLQVRTTDDDPLGTPTWSNWRPFIIGEYTARAFQFRVILTALISDITPIVSSLQVAIDMPDRIVSSDDIVVPNTGSTITYGGGAFRVAPAIAVSADDMNTGDYYTITSKSATSFNIQFFNSSAVGVERTFSYVAKGYGKVV